MRYSTMVKRSLAALALSISTATPMFGCATATIEQFSWTTHPSLPPMSYADGKLGVLRPSFARSYLVIAYRYLSGHPLSKAEQDDACRLINHRLGDQDQSQDADSSAWLAARQQVLGKENTPKTISTQKSLPDSMNYICNCQTPAFKKAAETLADRIKMLGATNPSVKEWVEAVLGVFGCCV